MSNEVYENFKIDIKKNKIELSKDQKSCLKKMK
jgi:hypothetical protein